MINDRNGGNHSMSGMPGTAGKLLPDWAWGDYTTPEQEVPDHRIPQRPWETCMTINDTWAYNPNDQNYKSATKLITTLAEVVSKGGNFLLNVGPRPDGTIQPEFVERFAAIGAWMRRHGESIYGTRTSDLARQDWGYSTAKDKAVYLQITTWAGPEGDQVVVDGLPGAVHQVSVLGSAAPVELTRDGTRTTLRVPAAAHDEHVTVIKVLHG
jgi:alpha-L-fucosidase